MRIVSSFSSGRVAGAIREAHESLMSVEVRRVDGTECTVVATIELTSAESDQERPVQAGEHPRETVEEIDQEIGRLAEEHARVHGKGLYQVELTSAKPRTGTRRHPIVVDWWVTPRAPTQSSEEKRIERLADFYLRAVEQQHAMHMETLANTHTMIGSMGRLWGDVASITGTLQEKAVASAQQNVELEALRIQREGDDNRLAFALQALKPLLGRMGGQMPPDGAIEVVPTRAAMTDAAPPNRGLLERAHAWARSITPEQRARLHEDLRRAVTSIETATSLSGLLNAIREHRDRVMARHLELSSVLEKPQLHELVMIVETALAPGQNQAAAE